VNASTASQCLVVKKFERVLSQQEDFMAISHSNTLARGGALAGHRCRVIVSTDIGGTDADDFQSMVH
jgi:hypothetical protein